MVLWCVMLRHVMIVPFISYSDYFFMVKLVNKFVRDGVFNQVCMQSSLVCDLGFF